jgi:hypothetical protein
VRLPAPCRLAGDGWRPPGWTGCRWCRDAAGRTSWYRFRQRRQGHLLDLRAGKPPGGAIETGCRTGARACPATQDDLHPAAPGCDRGNQSDLQTKTELGSPPGRHMIGPLPLALAHLQLRCGCEGAGRPPVLLQACRHRPHGRDALSRYRGGGRRGRQTLDAEESEEGDKPSSRERSLRTTE